jgi:hypothetical protein
MPLGAAKGVNMADPRCILRSVRRPAPAFPAVCQFCGEIVKFMKPCGWYRACTNLKCGKINSPGEQASN